MTAHKSDIESAVSILLTPGGLDLNALDAGLGYAMGAGLIMPTCIFSALGKRAGC